MRPLDLATMLALGAMWGSSFLFMRIAVPALGAPVLVEVRLLIAAIAITIAGKLAGQRLPRGREWRPCVMIGVFYTAVPLLLWAWAAHSVHASLLSIINATAPLFGAVVAALCYGEVLSRAGLAGLALGFAGVALLVGGEGIPMGIGSAAPVAALIAAFAAALMYGVMANYSGAIGTRVPPWTQALGSMWVAAAVSLPAALYFSFSASPPASAWAAVLALGLLSTGIAYVMYFRFLARVGAARALAVTYLIPLFGTLWGAAFLGERVGPHTVAGGIMIVAGIALVARARRPR